MHVTPRIVYFLAAAVLSVTLVAPAAAAVGNEPPEAPSPSSTESMQEGGRFTPRQAAERDYGDAYREIGKAKKEVAGGKAKQAEKRFRKALERAQSAVALDSAYFEAWNLVGYASRGLKDYDRSLAAYGRCLAINPNYAPAREYLGEAYVELKDAQKAREQLAWLEKFGATDTILGLRSKIEALEASPPPPPVAGEATSPSTSTNGSAGAGR